MKTKAKGINNKIIIKIIICLFAVVIAFAVAFADWQGIYELFGIYPKTENITVAFIDVGQADSIYINTEKGNILIDSGYSRDAQAVREYLDRYHIKKIDRVIGTHTDWDHIGGMSTIIEKYHVKRIYIPKYDNKYKSDVFAKLTKTIEDNKINVSYVDRGVSLIKTDDLNVRILSPVDFEDNNDSSLVVKLRYKDSRFLFMGDASSNVEEKLLEKNITVSADVLKVSHHGSRSATTQSFLNAVNPTAAVLSVGDINTYNLPSIEVVQRLTDFGCKIYRTDLQGNIVMNSDGKSINVQTEK